MTRIRDGAGHWEQEYFVPLVFDRGAWWLDLGLMFTDNLETVRHRADFIAEVWGSWVQPYRHKIVLDRL